MGAIPGHTSPSIQSASSMLVRPLSHGSQTFTPQPSEYPVGVPIHKLEARIQVLIIIITYMPPGLTMHACNDVTLYVQASGEAEYTTDMPILPNEVAAAFVLTTKVCII